MLRAHMFQVEDRTVVASQIMSVSRGRLLTHPIKIRSERLFSSYEISFNDVYRTLSFPSFIISFGSAVHLHSVVRSFRAEPFFFLGNSSITISIESPSIAYSQLRELSEESSVMNPVSANVAIHQSFNCSFKSSWCVIAVLEEEWVEEDLDLWRELILIK